MKVFVTALALILSFSTTQAFAAAAATAPPVKLSAAEAAQHAKWQKYVNDMDASYAKYPVEMCGHAIPITIEPAMSQAFIKAGNELGNYCEQVRTKVAITCRNGEDLKNGNKKKLAAAIKKITCKLGKTEDMATYNLVNGDLQATLGVKASNIEEKLITDLVAKGIAEGM